MRACRLWNNIVPVSKLAHGSNFSLFKEGIEPKWEDPANSHGGKWLFTITTKQNRHVERSFVRSLARSPPMVSWSSSIHLGAYRLAMRWLTCGRLRERRKEALDQYWLWTALALIGECFQADSDICGSVVSIRKPQDKIALWTRDTDAHMTTSIGYV